MSGNVSERGNKGKCMTVEIEHWVRGRGWIRIIVRFTPSRDGPGGPLKPDGFVDPASRKGINEFLGKVGLEKSLKFLDFPDIVFHIGRILRALGFSRSDLLGDVTGHGRLRLQDNELYEILDCEWYEYSNPMLLMGVLWQCCVDNGLQFTPKRRENRPKGWKPQW